MASRNNRFTRRGFIAAGAAAAASFGVPTLVRAQAKPVKVGLVNPMTGFLAYSGAQCRLGAMLAIDEINAAGGIKAMGGAKLEPLLGDNAGEARSRRECGREDERGGRAAYIGCFSSAVALPSTQAAAKYNTPFIIDIGASDNIVNRGLKNVFRLMPGSTTTVNDAIVGLGEINKAAGGPAKSAVLVHEESEFGTGTAKLLSGKLPGIGIEVKEVMKHANPTRDFANVALRIRSLKPDLVIMSNYVNEYMLLARTLHQQKVDLAGMFSVLGGGFNYKFVKELPEVAQYMLDMNMWFDPTNPKAQAMKKRVEAKGDLFTFEVYLSYSAVKLLADSLERARSADKEKLLAALESSTWSDHPMPYGPTKFVNGQNQGGRPVMLQASKSDIDVVWPSKYASAKPVFPKPKFS